MLETFDLDSARLASFSARSVWFSARSFSSCCFSLRSVVISPRSRIQFVVRGFAGGDGFPRDGRRGERAIGGQSLKLLA